MKTTWRAFPTAGGPGGGADDPAEAKGEYRFGQADLVGLWFKTRIPGIAIFVLPVLLLGLAWGSLRLLLAGVLAVPVLVDACLRPRRCADNALPVIMIDQATLAGGLILLGAPLFVLIVSPLYYAAIAASLLRASRLAAALCWNALTVAAVLVSSSHIPPALTPTRATALGITAVALFGVLLLGEVVLLEKVVRRYHSTREAHWRARARSRDQFLSGVSHALRTPLTGVVGFSRILADDYGLAMSKETRQIVSDLNQNAEELSILVEDLIVRAEDDAGALRLTPVAGDLRVITADVIAGSVRLYPDKVLSLLGEPAVPVFADPTRTRHVIRHLISNAIQHGGDHIVAEVARGTRATLVVRDDGPGLLENRNGLAAPALSHSDPHNPSPLMGLGLPVSLRLVELMGGALTYDRVGAATLFRLTLPAASPVQAKSEPAPKATLSPNTEAIAPLPVLEKVVA